MCNYCLPSVAKPIGEEMRLEFGENWNARRGGILNGKFTELVTWDSVPQLQ